MGALRDALGSYHAPMWCLTAVAALGVVGAVLLRAYGLPKHNNVVFTVMLPGDTSDLMLSQGLPAHHSLTSPNESVLRLQAVTEANHATSHDINTDEDMLLKPDDADDDAESDINPH